jgi:two-component system sensor histidine kinase CpxA
MRTLFGKIFLSFWLMVLLTCAITILVIRLSKPQTNELPPHLSKSVVRAELAYHQNGEKGLIRWGMHVNRKFAPHKVFVLSKDKDLLNQELPMSVLELANNISAEQKTIGQRFGKNVYFGYYMTDSQGNGYKLIFDRPPAGKEKFKLLFQNIWIVILLVAGFTGTFCYLLARSFARPIKAIQEATKALADGDLDIQVADQFKGRKDEIGALANDFDRMTQQLKHAYNHQSRLIHDMSHELRAPISRMQVALALLEQEETLSSTQGKAMFDRVQAEINQFDQIIKQTLALPLFEQQKHPTLDAVQDISTTLESLIDDLQFEAQSDLAIHLTTEPETGPFLIQTKDNWLDTILRNLISNALQYRQANTEIRIQLTTAGDVHKVCVFNEGNGV